MLEFLKVENRILIVSIVVGGKSITLGEIDKNGFLCLNSEMIRLVPETLKTIAIKAKEVREWGVDPESCLECNGTPYFPNGKCFSARHLEFY